ncbi:MAG: hypothetical protein Q4D38_13075, partial [Planctomycetia bacterium]|nr:hypothetical protein [Planctomycetia bacterium]
MNNLFRLCVCLCCLAAWDSLCAADYTLTGVNTWNGSNTYTNADNLTLSDGTTINVTSNTASSGRNGTDYYGNIYIAGNTSATIVTNGSQSTILNGNLTGSGTLVKDGGAQLHLDGDNTAFAGTIRVTNSWLSIYDSDATSALATYEINSGMVFAYSTSEVSLGMLTGAGTVRPGEQLTPNSLTLKVGGADLSGTFSGKLLDYRTTGGGVLKALSLEKVGTGTWILNTQALSTGELAPSGT